MTTESKKVTLPEDITEDGVFELVQNMLGNYDIDISEAEEDIQDILKEAFTIIRVRGYRAGFTKGVNTLHSAVYNELRDKDKFKAFERGLEIGSGERNSSRVKELFNKEFENEKKV